MFHHILVLVNPEKDNRPAIERALRLSIPNRTEITLLSLVYSRALDSDYLFDEKGRTKAHDAYKSQCSRKLLPIQYEVNKLGIDTHIDVRWSKHKQKDLDAIIDELHVDLVIKTVREHGTLERLFLGHHEWQLINHCKVPLLLANPSVQYMPNPTVTVAIDPVQSHDKPNTLDHDLLKMGQELSVQLAGQTAVFHSYDPVPPSLLTDADSVSYQDLTNTIRQRHKLAFAEFMRQHPINHEYEWLQEGDIFDELPKALASHHSPLVVMGAIARSKLDHWLIGSTAERLLEVIGSDILILKPNALH